MPATPSIKINHTFLYRGQTKTWSNRWHFNGGTPADPAHWSTLGLAIIAAEKLCFTNDVTLTGWVGYNAGSDLPIASGVTSTAGTYTKPGGGYVMAGDAAAMMKWSTTARTSKNHPIYLFSYMHGILGNTSSAGDVVDSSQRALFNVYGAAWVTGFSDGTNTYVRAGPNGATGAYVVATNPWYVRHRDFPS